MKILLIVVITFTGLGLKSQTLDLSQPEIVMKSKLYHMSTNKEIYASERPLHDKDTNKSYPFDQCLITINTVNKTIVIVNQVTNKKLYSLDYSKSYQGKGKAVVLKPEESMFMVGDERVDMVTYDAESQTLDVFLKDKQIELFGRLEIQGNTLEKIENGSFKRD
jgi:hypothetical protein